MVALPRKDYVTGAFHVLILKPESKMKSYLGQPN